MADFYTAYETSVVLRDAGALQDPAADDDLQGARLQLAYGTTHGQMLLGKVEDFFEAHLGKQRRGKAHLIFTSPPFPLNRNSAAMLELLRTKKYTSGKRPSQHDIGAESFLKDNGGAIPSNVLTISNTRNQDPYYTYCRERGLPLHPARMPMDLPEFFIKFLTRPGELVLDPFAGSNTTGAAAERLGRRWVSIEPNPDYVRGSIGRFDPVAVLKEVPRD